jgi:hypothetical protein
MARAQKKLRDDPTITQEQQEREQVMAPPQEKRASKPQVDNEDTTMPEDGAEDATLPENAMKPPAERKMDLLRMSTRLLRNQKTILTCLVPNQTRSLFLMINCPPWSHRTQVHKTLLPILLDFEEQVASLIDGWKMHLKLHQY